MIRHPSPETLLPDFVTKVLATPRATRQLLSLGWSPKLQRQIDSLLAEHAKPKTLAAWRLHHDDFQGAAGALYPSLDQLQRKVRRTGADNQSVENEYLTIINLLSCTSEDKAWILSKGGNDMLRGGQGKRGVVSLGNLREQYQEELDRRSIIDGGKYAFTGNDEEGDAMELV